MGEKETGRERRGKWTQAFKQKVAEIFVPVRASTRDWLPNVMINMQDSMHEHVVRYTERALIYQRLLQCIITSNLWY